MNNLGVGYGPVGGSDNFLMIFLMLMIMCPGMLGGMGDNSMMFFLIMIMMMNGGRMC